MSDDVERLARTSLSLIVFRLLSEEVQHVTIAAHLGSGQAGKATDFGSVIRRFESFLPSRKKRRRSNFDRRRLRREIL